MAVAELGDMLPSRRQWERWSLPSKLTAIGAFVGVTGLLFSIVAYVFPWPYRPKDGPMQPATLDAELVLRYEGFKVRVSNIGQVTATGVNVAVISWRVGAPAADVWKDFPIRNLPPGDSTEFRVQITPARFSDKPDTRSLYSGFYSISSHETAEPRMWAFSIPVETLGVATSPEGHWPAAQFGARHTKPYLMCVDVPRGVCVANGIRSWHWTP